MLFTFLPGVLITASLSQATITYLRDPNPYRRKNWYTKVFMGLGLVVVVYVPKFATGLPHDVSPNVRLLAHHLFNVCVMLSGYFSAIYCDDIMYGLHSLIARRKHRHLTTYLLATLAVMAIFLIRGLLGGERENSNWFANQPLQNGDLIIVSIACLSYMSIIYLQLIQFSQQFARITPIPAFKTGNSCCVIACYLGLGNSIIAFTALWVPAASALTPALELGVIANTLLLLVVLYLGLRLVDVPGKRLRRFGEWVWALITIARIYPLWRVVTYAIPEVIPPVKMPWIVVILHNKLEMLRDARIIEILDVLHRLDVTLWSEHHSHEWHMDIQQIATHPLHLGAVPTHQAREIEQLAQRDAARLVIALANYLPSDRSPVLTRRIAAPVATISHAPSFSGQEVHYLELVATAFQRMYAAASSQPALVTSRFDVVAEA